MFLKGEKTSASLAIPCALLLLFFTVVLPDSLSADTTPSHSRPNADSTANFDGTQSRNLMAFARLYGYVRFFHPSDKARAIDWDRFAYHGVRFVKHADTQSELMTRLGELFHPLAPTVQLYSVNRNPPEASPALVPEKSANLKLVAWQHKGFGFGGYDAYKSIRINRPASDPAAPLFEKHAQAGEVVRKRLGMGIAARIPLALFSEDGQTIRPDHAPSAEALQAKLDSIPIDSLTADNRALRQASVIIAWNIFQHFYPYFDLVEVNWEDVLRKSLAKAYEDRNPGEFTDTLRWMVARLQDGHGTVIPPVDTERYLRFPFKVRLMENKLVISEVSPAADENACFKKGDIIRSIDNTPATQWLEEKKKLISGTSQHKTVTALRRLTYGLGETYTFVFSRPDSTFDCTLTQGADINTDFKKPPPFKELRDDIYYVDLRNISMKSIRKKTEILATAKGIVFDVRGRPNGNHEVLRHLSKDTLRSPRWMIPQYMYPDQENIAGYDTSGRWTLPPKEPYFPGERVFLSNRNTISYGESVMGIVEHYDLGEIAGETTAGANGNVASYTLPGNYTIRWTGMRVLKHDYSQHHLVGIKPDIPVRPSIEDLRAGKDSYIEKAVEVINSSLQTDD